MRACLGGWCRIREGCDHYHADDRAHPAERLCIPGRDGLRYGMPQTLRREPIAVPDNELPTALRGGALEIF